MRKLYKSFIVISVMLIMAFAMSGCSEDTYEHAKQYQEQSLSTLKDISAQAPIEAGEGIEHLEENMDRMAATGTKYLSDKSKQVGIWIMIASALIGIILVIITKDTSAIKIYKIAWMVFIIGIPVITFISIFGLAILASWFM